MNKDIRYYKTLGLADLYLDTTTVNGHTIVADALWAGVPCLTQPGHKLFTRVGSSLLKAMGVPELVVDTEQSYISEAVMLATNRTRLAMLKQKIMDARATSPLFDTQRYVRDFEKGVHEMYNHRNSPLDIYVKSVREKEPSQKGGSSAPAVVGSMPAPTEEVGDDKVVVWAEDKSGASKRSDSSSAAK
eukprot:GFYU01019436.1.p2 GENE.GFYU01019436.1~~GFYU01019436.1.p2  ORF type:complete len:188 (+),score=32.58 GFYU01019436.1:3-566(+)